MVLKDLFTPKVECIFRLSKCCDVIAYARHLSTLLVLVRIFRKIPVYAFFAVRFLRILID